MKNPTFDSNGYPTKETLNIIKSWPLSNFEKLLQFIAKAWKYPEKAQKTNSGF